MGNLTALARDYSYPPSEQLTSEGLANCDYYNHINQNDITIEKDFEHLFGHDAIVDELVNGDGDVLVNIPQANGIQGQVAVAAYTWSAAPNKTPPGSTTQREDQYMDWFVLDDNGQPRYIATMQLASLVNGP